MGNHATQTFKEPCAFISVIIQIVILTKCFHITFFNIIFTLCNRVLSALAHWSPIFGEVDYLPMLVFPIVKMFPNNQLVCFEFVVAILGEYSSRVLVFLHFR